MSLAGPGFRRRFVEPVAVVLTPDVELGVAASGTDLVIPLLAHPDVHHLFNRVLGVYRSLSLGLRVVVQTAAEVPPKVPLQITPRTGRRVSMRTGRRVGFQVAARVRLRVTIQESPGVTVQVGRGIAGKTHPQTLARLPLGIAPGTVPGTVPPVVRWVSFLARIDVPNRLYFGHLGQFGIVPALRLSFTACATRSRTRKTASPGVLH